MISSTSNPQIKRLVQLQKKSKARTEEQVFVVEGLRMFEEVPVSRLEKVYVSETFYNKKKQELSFQKIPVEILADHVFEYVSDTKTPQGILCVVRQRNYDLEKLLNVEKPHFIVLDNLQDPGNLGTIIRSAVAFNIDTIILTENTVD